jgi:hypothetical protein
MSNGEWELIGDPLEPARRPGDVGRPRSVDRRRIVDAIFYVGGMPVGRVDLQERLRLLEKVLRRIRQEPLLRSSWAG